MDRDNLESISATLNNIAGVVAELSRQWHPSMGGKPSFAFFESALQREGEKLRLQGQPLLADGMIALRTEIGAMNNG